MALLQSQHAPPWAQRASQLSFPIFDDKLQQFPNANFFLLASGTDQLDQFCLTSWLLTKISLKLRDLSNDTLLSPYWCSDLQKADEIVGWILSISVQSANRHVGYHQNFLHNRVAGRQISHMAIQTDSEIMDPFRQILDSFIFAFCTAWSPIWSGNYTHQKPFFMSFRNFLHRKKKCYELYIVLLQRPLLIQTRNASALLMCIFWKTFWAQCWLFAVFYGLLQDHWLPGSC